MKKNSISVPVLLAVGALLATSIQTHAQDNKAAVPNADETGVAEQTLEDTQPLQDPSVAEQAASSGADTAASAETVESTETAEGAEITETAEGTDTAEGGPVDEVMQKLSEQLPGIQFTEVSESTIPGLFEVIADGQIYYVNESAQYLIDGSLIRLSDRANLTDARLGRIHMDLIDAMDEKDMLIYEPETPSERSITVFTDISCGYCRRLHAELDTLLDEGVRVRYLLFPRAGLGSQGHKDLVSVWCADNPQEAMTNAKAGGKIEALTCDNPVEKHVALAERVGLRGTPLIYTDSGEKVPGYREAATLATMVNHSEPLAN